MIDRSAFSWKTTPTQPKGVICGAEITQEWLLPWWWERYREHNALPVVFFDFGMSEEMKEWCKARGELISIPFEDAWVTQRAVIDPALSQQWKKVMGGLCGRRVLPGLKSRLLFCILLLNRLFGSILTVRYWVL